MSDNNPEVMGRTEPRKVPTPQTTAPETTTNPQTRTDPQTTAPQATTNPQQTMAKPQTDGWSEMVEIRRRFEELQSEFIERPQDAVKKAERLTEEAIDKMTKLMHEQISSIHRDIEGNSDTERLRLAMRNYRILIDSMSQRQAA